MDTWTAITTRRAVRDFDGRPLDPAHLERICEAGRRAPSSMNEQRWDFIVCVDREHLHELAQVGDYAGHLAGAAAAVALVTPDAAEGWLRESIAFDLGQAAQNMMLAAWDLGIGSVHASVYDEERTRLLLGYPEGMRCDVLLSFGYPADPGVLGRPPSGGRKPLDDLIHLERWGARRS